VVPLRRAQVVRHGGRELGARGSVGRPVRLVRRPLLHGSRGTVLRCMQRPTVFVLACFVGACGGTVPATPAASTAASTPAIAHVTTPTIDVAELDSIIAQVVERNHLVGLSVGVLQDGDVVLAKGYGFRSLDPREPVEPTTMFPVGSVTKQFTCSTALLLQEDGTLSVDDPVAKYVPTATRASDITLLELGQHVTGYRDYYPLDFVDREMQRPQSADSIIARYATRPLDFEPGTRWSYSNTNFLILGKAIEAAAGEPVGDVVRQRIFEPLGMTRTSWGPPPGDGDAAKGYTSYALAPPSPVAPEAEGWTGAAGAIWSTPTDLLKWDLALIDGSLLSPASFATLTTPRTLADGRSTAYGCGLGIQATGNALMFTHGGAVAGAIAQNVIIPATRSAVVLFSNADFAAVGPIISAAVERLTPHIDVPVIDGPSALEAATTFLQSLERGDIDRSTLGADFDALLTPGHVAADRASLAALGRITNIRVTSVRERGGMEVALVQFTVGSTPAQSAMYRTPDGRIQQFLINRQ
jgi:D-alanyl-D-alanine carboxypeptidase